MKNLLQVSFVFLVASTLLWAGDFWEDTEFTQWSEKDVEKMMTNSPWAKRVTVSVSRRGGGGGRSGGLSGRQRGGGTGRAGMGGGRGGGRGGRSGGGMARQPALRLTISWRSALPVKQALVKRRMGDSTQIPEEARQFLDQQDESYMVAIIGFPAQMGRMARNPEALLAATILKRKKGSILPENVRAVKRDDSVDLFFFFPRSAGITLEDKDVEFIAELGPMEIKKKFKLKDMVLNGKLEL